ncbi:MAG: dihydroneopterin aldolase [Verrucomicrobia bacterium]|nr:MAG: dihydroneopterin aldolase [Verrucomicrobiota bacterium]
MPNEPNAFSDQIHIEELEISTHIGVPEEERVNPQRLTVSITLWPRHDARDLGDNIDKTINYSAVAEAAKSLARDQSVNLIETLANRLATHLLGNFAIQKIRVELRKFALPDAKHVSATVTRIASVR